MKQRKWRIAADAPVAVSKRLLGQFTPRFANVYLTSITWAFDVPQDAAFPAEVMDCCLYGLHTGPTTQAFLARLGGETERPDGKLLRLTFCTDSHTRPVHAGAIDPAQVVAIDPVYFAAQLKLFPLFEQRPTHASPPA